MTALENFFLNLPLPLIDHWGYLLVFLSALAEALPAVGSFFPGHTVIILSGFLAQLGVLRLDAAIVAASAGAVIGDLLAYFIGLKYGHDFISRYGKYFFFHPDKYEATKRLVNQHAGKTLIIGRFNSFTRAFAPFIAGISRVKFSRFFLYALVGGVAWAASSVLIGYIFGQSFGVAAKYFGRLVFGGLVAIILLAFGYRWLDKRRHIFAKYHVYYFTLNALAIYVFSKMAEDYLQKESTYRLDLWLDGNISRLWQPWLNQVMIIITNVFSPEVFLAAAIPASLYFFFKKQWYRASLVILSVGGGLTLGALVKLLLGRLRPVGGLVAETGLSFPSLHALAAAIFFSLLLFGLAEKIKSRALRYLFIAGNIFMILLVNFSRLYLKVHWFSDVAAGLALGLFWLTLLILIFRIAGQLFNKPVE